MAKRVFVSIVTSNTKQMKKRLHVLVTFLSMLALILPTTAFCLQPHHTTHRLCDHCPPRNAPPACCSSHHPQPSTIPPSIKTQQPSQSLVTFLPAFLGNVSLRPANPVVALKAPPPPPLLLALRI
jgi:hypothetical protein